MITVVPFGYGSVNDCPSLLAPLTVAIPQLSVAVAVPVITCAEQVPGSVAAVILAGQVIVGGSLSLTVMVCRHDELLPVLSVAVQVIFTVPTGYGSVMGLLSLRLGTGVTVPSQLSVAVATPTATLAEQLPGKLTVVTLFGQVIAGGVVSLTVNVVVQVLLLPAGSVAVTVIV